MALTLNASSYDYYLKRRLPAINISIRTVSTPYPLESPMVKLREAFDEALDRKSTRYQRFQGLRLGAIPVAGSARWNGGVRGVCQHPRHVL